MPRYHRYRKDGNHHPIVDALTGAGVTVRDLSEAGGGVTDLLTLYRGVLRLVEIKNPANRSRRLTELQKKFRDSWPTYVVETAAEALAVHGIEVVGSE